TASHLRLSGLVDGRRGCCDCKTAGGLSGRICKTAPIGIMVLCDRGSRRRDAIAFRRFQTRFQG
ncbi:MAG: hypothetical protein OXE40_00255, partial [Gammaproteobacteria bacterium]|nr:hypothetical protein [Gammaproteobacteria bacterium]